MIADELVVRPLFLHLVVDDGQQQLRLLLQTPHLPLVHVRKVEYLRVVARSRGHHLHHGLVQISALGSVQGVLIGLQITVAHLLTENM